MFGIVLGVGIAVVALYELLIRENPPTTEQATRAARAAIAAQINANAGNDLVISPETAKGLGIAPALAARCKLQYSDISAASQWSSGYLGAQLAMPERLEMMRSIVAWDSWPPSARRAYCALTGKA